MTLKLQSSNTRALLAVALTLAILAPVFASSRAARSLAAVDRAQSNLDATASIAAKLTELQRQSAAVGDRPSPEPDLVARLHHALHLTGISPGRLTRVSMQASQAIRGSELKKQVVAITIGPIRAPDLARCLNQWSQSEPLWTIRSVRLDRIVETRSRQRSARNPSAPADEYNASITLERIHLAMNTNPQGSPS